MVFEQQQVAKPRFRRRSEGCFPVSRPKVCSITERLLNAIIEVVTEGTDMRLQFNNGNQIVVDLDDQVPVFGWPEVTG